MYGAILGDMIGAPYEFDRGSKTKTFPMFTDKSQFTDDSVMTIAVAEALLDTMGGTEAEVKEALVRSTQKWGRRYPDSGYGTGFRGWLWENQPQPYGSYGNGSAMRVSAASWLYDTLQETRKYARWTAEVTHNHPEGIKGAEATASAIFLARTGHSKEEIRDYTVREFGYDLSRTCDEIRPTYHHVESCQQTVPEAITAFLEGNDFEDVIRTAVSLGGDCDTLTCIAGSIAEAFYGVPAVMETECKARLPEDMLAVLERFDQVRGQTVPEAEDELGDNREIEEAIALYYEDGCREHFVGVLEAIRKAMHQKNCMLIPMVLKNPECISIDPEHAKVGDTFTNEEPLRFALHHIQTEDGKRWLVAFTSREEYEKGEDASTMAEGIKPMLRRCGVMPGEGFIINPWGGKAFLLTKELMQLILDVNKPENGIYFEVGDITKLDVEVIVNAANKSLLGGGGVDGAIHRAAGPGLLEECRTLGGCEVGEAKITGGYDLKAEFVIHTVGPRYRKDDPECPRLLAASYTNSLELAKKYNLHVIAFPAISTGVYGYPPQEAAKVALRAVENWLTANPDYGMAVVMSCYDQKMRQCYQNVIDAYAPGKE